MSGLLGEIPGPVRETLARMEKYWAIIDTDRATALRIVLRDAELEAVAASAVAGKLLQRRMRERVNGLKLAHPELSMRKVLYYVGRFTGYNASRIGQLYYTEVESD